MPAEKAPSQLSDLFARLSGLLFSEETLQSALDLSARLAHEVLPGTAGAGVTLIREGKRLTAAYSDELVKRADALQYDLDEGPCLSAWKDGRPYLIESMEKEDRWPRWAPAARGLGMRSAISFPLVVRGNHLGAVKAYSSQNGAYDERDVRTLEMFANQAGIVLANVVSYTDAQEMGSHLKRALRTRQEIAMAMGILMEREAVDEERAFTVLRNTAGSRNVKLHQVASELVGSAGGAGQ